MRGSNQVPTLYNSRATSPLTKAVVVAMAGMILPAISLLYGKNNNKKINKIKNNQMLEVQGLDCRWELRISIFRVRMSPALILCAGSERRNGQINVVVRG